MAMPPCFLTKAHRTLQMSDTAASARHVQDLGVSVHEIVWI